MNLSGYARALLAYLGAESDRDGEDFRPFKSLEHALFGVEHDLCSLSADFDHGWNGLLASQVYIPFYP
jgi:hypothetical protein